MKLPRLKLRAGKEKSLLRRHPWIFSGAIAETDGVVSAGATVDVVSSSDQYLARAAYSPQSQIRARVWTFEPGVAIDAAFFARRLEHALSARTFIADQGDAIRLVHGEADGLPGLVVDRYADQLVVQLSAQGVERHRGVILSELQRITGLQKVYERSDADVRGLEGLPPVCGPVGRGESSEAIEIRENGLIYTVDIAKGQKTGFYIDQRNNRRRVAQIARGDVLNCFCYTGGFSLAALHGGASTVTSIDSSAEALELAQLNAAQNGFSDDRATWICEDVFVTLRRLRDQGRQFDVIILDPPKFAPTLAHVEKAARAYKDINLLGLKLLRPGGLLVTFSCSGGVTADLFQKIVAGAAVDARVNAQIVERFFAPADHPVLLSFPEGDYLKGLVVRRSSGD